MTKHAVASLSVALTCSLAVSCGAAPGDDAPAEMSLATARERPYIRPRPIALQINPEQVRASGGVESIAHKGTPRTINGEPVVSALFTPGGAPLPIYLERNQVTYTGGSDNSASNRSSVVGSGSATVGGYTGSDSSWNQIVACVQDEFSRFNVTVTDVEPASGEYVEAHFGGSPGQIGLPSGVGGVAPIDSYSCNIIPRAIVYIFSDVLGGSVQTNCEVAAQEIAHAFSLDHEYLCQDPMTYLGGCGAKTFQDTGAQCGEYEPRQCNCNRSTQNSVTIMVDKLGGSAPLDPGDTIPPVAQLTSPADGATFQSSADGTPLQVTATATDSGTIVARELVWSYNNQVFACPGTSDAVSCTVSGNTMTWNITVGLGDRTFSLRVRDGGGNVTETPARTIHLTTDGATPPPVSGDTTAPVVTVVSPANGQELLANSSIEIEARVTDDSGAPNVELVWPFGDNVFACPLAAGGSASCTRTGDTYVWTLNVGSGSRSFSVRAVDAAGNETLSAERTINLVADPAEPPPPPTGGDDDLAEPNDDANAAFSSRCGTGFDVVASPGDDDWYAIEAPDGTDVEVGIVAVAGTPIAVTLFQSDGTTELASAPDVLAQGGSVATTSPGPVVLARITTSSATSVSYRLAVTCGNGDQPPPPPPPGSDDALEPNNTTIDATRSFCGQQRAQLAALDEDFFVVSVRNGDTLRVHLATEGALATIVDADGNVIADASAEPVADNLTAGDVYVRVDPEGEGANYDVEFACAAFNAQPTPVGACACSGTGPEGVLLPAAGLALLALRRRRRA
ncbi:MAG: hypothetical protein HYS27_02585 [Deltaproteobacteria bacterium]|nr:hypothetical protein [Deltaproteobacteria bacterium]